MYKISLINSYKKKVHPITGRRRGALLNEADPEDTPAEMDQSGGDSCSNDSENSSDQISAEDSQDDIDGGLGADLIDAGSGSDEVDGGKGDDLLDGGHGDDTLIGGLGDDTFAGGEGADSFELSLGSDVIQDFNPDDGHRIILPDGQDLIFFRMNMIWSFVWRMAVRGS